VRQYRIVHEAGGLEVEVVLADGVGAEAVSEAIANTLRERLGALGVDPPPIRVLPIERLTRAPGPAAKLKLIESRP
jgi:type IV pilus biogenesis protein CpaD/CtpE